MMPRNVGDKQKIQNEKRIPIMQIPRNEHPRPDRKREDWLCLNGTWDFEIDDARVGVAKRFYERPSLEGKIVVPFCPESKLSGLAHTDFINAVWYRRALEIPAAWAGKRILLHVDACDHTTTVYVNGKSVGTHVGGYTPFAFDVTDYLAESGNYVTIYAEDDMRSDKQLLGKQSSAFHSYGCHYTRTTGIWQTVWLEAVESVHVTSYKIYANITAPAVTIETICSGAAVGATLRVIASYEGREMGVAETVVNGESTTVTIALAERHLWEVGCGRLYDLRFELTQGGKTDVMDGYFGLREIGLSKERGLQINGKSVYGRFVLDQGFYPDGIYTAPSDEALIYDIETAMACGFNGARLHQKVFEPRYLYHADRLGYMLFDETGNWGFNHTDFAHLQYFLPAWLEEMERDFSHPAVIGWCPFNETWDKYGKQQSIELIDAVYDITKALDKTRIVIANSGSYPTTRTDVHDVHDYEQDPATFRGFYAEIEKGLIRDQLYRMDPKRQHYNPVLPIFVSEYGGTRWVANVKEGDAWGYGVAVKTEEEYLARLEGLTDVLLETPAIFGYCYTQLTDVEQEVNGIMTYERKLKFPAESFRRIFGKGAWNEA